MGAGLNRQHGRTSATGTVTVTNVAADATIPNPGFHVNVHPNTLDLIAPAGNSDAVFFSQTAAAVVNTGVSINPGEMITIAGGTGKLSLVAASGSQDIDIIAHYA